MATIDTGEVPATSQSKRFDAARTEIAEFLDTNIPNTAELARDRLTPYLDVGHTFLAGWQFPCDFDGLTVEVRVLLDENYPFSAPKIGLADGTSLSFAHLERGALICLAPNQTVSWNEPAKALAVLLGQAQEIIRNGLASTDGNEDSRREVLAYWNQRDGGKLATSFLHLDGTPRRIKRFDDKGRIRLFDNRAAAKAFFEASGRDYKPSKVFAKPATLIWLRRPPKADELPATVGELIRLLLDEAASGLDDLAQFLHCTDGRSTVVVGIADENGFGLFGVELPKVRFDPSGPQQLPFIIENDKNQAIERLRIRRADPPWVFGRDNNPSAETLQKKCVTIVGAGSLGSFVAQNLAASGVGKLIIVDPETLTFENTSRHVLGADAVDIKKAEALALVLQRRFRTSEFVGVSTKWQTWIADKDTNLNEIDLIVSTIGDWPIEIHLADHLRSESNAPAVMFAWLEPHAIASHAVILPTSSPCLCCGFDTKSSPKWPVTNWPGQTRRDVPLCGGQYQPYGIADLTTHASSISQAAITYLVEETSGSQHVVQSVGEPGVYGGKWSNWWIGVNGDQPADYRRLVREWEKDDKCPMCSQP